LGYHRTIARARTDRGETEEEIYSLFDLPWIPPELREDRGEVEAAQQGALPGLVALNDIRGDLRSHTTASDGRASLEEMARAAEALGHEYLAVTDHSAHIGVTQGLDADELEARIEEIERPHQVRPIYEGSRGDRQHVSNW
jgi:DNA polymerase (family 10)